MPTKRNIRPTKTVSPTVTSIHYDATCRTCGASHAYTLDHRTEDFEELELSVHVDLDDRGWIDGECGRCAVAPKDADRAYDESVERELCQG